MKSIAMTVLGAGLLVASLSVSATAGGLPDRLKSYELEGTSKTCVHTRSIKRTTALDDRNILFEMNGKKKYLNRLRGRCARLGMQDSFAYKTIGGQLCRGEIITVLHDGDPGGSCSLGSFELLEKKEKSE